MPPTTYLFIAILVMGAAAALWLTGAARVLFRYRGKMLFTCPETGEAACVKVAAASAAQLVDWTPENPFERMFALARAAGLWAGVPEPTRCGSS
jgi:hypothetical protein